MLIGFIGLGKLGMPCAEAIAHKGYDVAGYDIIKKESSVVDIRESIKELVEDRDIVFVAIAHPITGGKAPEAPPITIF